MKARAVLGLAASLALGWPAPGTTREVPGQLRARLQATLDGARARAVSAGEAFPGATAALVLSDGRLITLATGDSDVEKGLPMTPDLLMPAGSIGKTFVSAVALSLVNDGLLELDAPISTWLGSETWFRRLPIGPDITLRMLLNHSSGLPNHVFNAQFQAVIREIVTGDRDRILEPPELVGFVLDREPLFPPGEGYSYTDTGYILVGLILEKASGTPYYTLLQERILGPLELGRTLPQDRRSVPGLSQGYAVASEAFGLSGPVVENGTYLFHPQTEWTGGGLFSNSGDLARWAKTLYEGRAIRGPYLDALLGSAVAADRNDPRQTYGLGVDILEGPLGTSYGHDGFFPGYNSKMAYYPAHGVALAVQINADRTRLGDRYFETLARAVLSP